MSQLHSCHFVYCVYAQVDAIRLNEIMYMYNIKR